MSPIAMPATESDVQTDVQTDPARPWVTIVFDDPVNLMSYVTYVFRSYFGYPREKATQLMQQVHNEGKAVVAEGTREEMEKDTAAMHGYGLWASCRQMDDGGAV